MTIYSLKFFFIFFFFTIYNCTENHIVFFLGLGKEINWMKLEDAYVEAKKR